MSRGSEWNIWDLHIHTPASFHWEKGELFSQMTSQAKKNSCQSIIEEINSSEPIAFCIVDYFTFDGIFEIRKFLENKPGLLKKTIFPGIELRLDIPIRPRLNIQVIFSEDIEEQELKDFQSTLKIFSRHGDEILSKDAIIKSARNLPLDEAKPHIGHKNYEKDDDVAYELGCKTIEITINSFREATNKLGKDKCLIISPYETHGGIKNLDSKRHPYKALYLLGVTDFFESRKREYINLFLGKPDPKNKRFYDDFKQGIGGKSKPVLSGSDAHEIENYGVFPKEKKTWLKAEPTFKGLKQVAVEPASRCYIGECPKRLDPVKYPPTKFISNIQIKKKPGSQFKEIWFDDINIDFNTELVAIIGNKGSGKSALTDIIGLLGNSKQYESFSFLHKDRFREPNKCKAQHFEATLCWGNKDKYIKKSLDTGYDAYKSEKVKYIPQLHLETLCNEIKANGGEFHRELEGVIFSHIPDEDRYGKNDLGSLLKFKTEEVYQEINALSKQLENITEKILENREKETEEYGNKLADNLLEKEKEHAALEKSKPKPVEQPTNNTNSPEIQNKVKQLQTLRTESEKTEQEIVTCQNEINKISMKKGWLDKAIEQIRLLEQDIKIKTEEINTLLSNADYPLIGHVSYQKQTAEYKKSSETLSDKLEEEKRRLNDLENVKQSKEKSIEKLKEEIDAPNIKYQKYLSDKKIWDQKIANIKGNKDTPNTLEYIKAGQEEIQHIPEKITNLEGQRDKIVLSIHEKIKKIVEIYKNIYTPVQKFIDEESFEDNQFDISFNVGIKNTNFKETFFKLINRQKIGTFHGAENSEKQMEELLKNYDFDDSNSVVEFTKEIFKCLEYDCRDGNELQKIRFESQLKDNVTPEEFYNMIFGLEYLEPKYLLQLNKKNIEQLSPGERGILLLIFYLMIDKDDRPLIMDQPEENLDNQTIYEVLVQCIKKAKEKRQIFLVTHNPNLAVVCDAEQIIMASIDKEKANTVSYHSGAIENSETNKHVVDILEGTKPAFQNREDKYHELSKN